MKSARSFGAAFALVLIGAIAAFASQSSFWNGGSVTPGPWLGDYNFNINRLFSAHAQDNGMGYSPSLSVSQTSGQANCTQLQQDGLIEVKTSAGTGYVCLPSAIAGKRTMIGNGSTQTIDLYSSATPGVQGGATDTINGTAGTTPYTGLTNGKTAVCIASNNGAWYCGSIS
jgi:hypothetical protein